MTSGGSVLLDTNALLWLVVDPDRIAPRVLERLAAPHRVGDALGGDPLRDEPADLGVAEADSLAEREARPLHVAHRRSHGHEAHHLNPGGDRDVVRAGDDALRGEGRRLLRRSALAVDGGGGNRLGEAGGEHGVAAHIERLRADLWSRAAALRSGMQHMRVSVEEGRGLSAALAQLDFIPPLAQEMLATGERTGHLAKVLERLSEHYQRKLEHRLATLAKIVEPAMLLIMGALVAMIVSALILPIFKLSAAVH